MTETDSQGSSGLGPSQQDTEKTGHQSGGPRMWLSDTSIAQPVFITMFVLAMLVVGAMSYSRMGLDLLPEISFPVAVVQTAYPGANPEEIERSVTRPIEDAVVSLNGVDTVTSTSLDSVSTVVIQFNMEKDIRQAVDDVRTRIGVIRNSLPADTRDPVILRFDPSSAPILSFAIADASGKRSGQELREIADDKVKPRLEQVAGVAAVNITGGVIREVHVDLNAAQLQAQGIAPQQVIQAIRTESLDVPAGRIADGRIEELVRTTGEVASLAQLGEIPVVTKPGGVAVKIKDIATVSDGRADIRALSRLDGQNSVVGQVQKQSGINTVQAADDAKRELARLQQDYPDLNFAIASDQSTFTRDSVQDLLSSLIMGAILAALVVLLFFRDLRNTLVTVAGLPMVLLGTFAVLYALGLTLNMITLMALSLSVGMLIDDAIVVRENIFRHMEKGEEPKVAARRGTAEIALAVLAITSTIVAVFLPIAFTGGIAGQYLRSFGITVAVAVIISLIEAFTLAPMLSAYFFKRLDPAKSSKPSLFGRFFEGLNVGYKRLLAWSLHHRLAVIGIGVFTLAASIAILPTMVFSLMPDTDRGTFSVGIELPPGSRLADTDQAARTVERVLQSAPEVDHVFTTVGSSTGTVETARVNVRLRTLGQTTNVITRLRPQLEQAMRGVKFTVDRQSSTAIFVGGSSASLVGAPIQFAVQGDDFKLLDKVSADLVAQLRQIPGAVDADRSIKSNKPEQTVVIDRAKATDFGISSAQVGTTVRTFLTGDRAGTYWVGDKGLDIIIRLSEADRTDPASILRMPLMTARGTQIPLSMVASLVKSSAPSQINRENRQRQVLVGTSYLGRSAGAVLADARTAVASIDLPPGVSIKVTGQTKYQDEIFAAFGTALVLSVMFVYMILASQFGSFVHPFTIMLALPFSAIGAFLALFALRFNFDMLAMIGMILLMGLVTKNSILLVEFINQIRRRGSGVREAILEAGPIRLRPILMTTLAMIFGMIPAAAGLGAGAEMRQPMGVAVIGGLVTSTLLTLVVVPVAYSLIADLTSRLVPAHVTPVTSGAGSPAGTVEQKTQGKGEDGTVAPDLA